MNPGNKLRRGFISRDTVLFLDEAQSQVMRDTLLCDPLTGLVAFPCFERHVRSLFDRLNGLPITLAIGDVDDLRGYVTSQKARDSECFGHVAGNRCMAEIGRLVSEWESVNTHRLEHLVAGTFGGDEVILCLVGGTRETCQDMISDLAERIAAEAPRPCSFAWKSRVPETVKNSSEADFSRFISSVDSALFDFKDRRLKGLTIASERIVEVLSCRAEQTCEEEC